ncbi:Ribophorin I [Schizophyllum amplum]|uniref:Dolichyl-diphosphooligosaccharide--protein glycosyltransferase subunit 1 n=1 Tax=Schizophyllum amplum TaxID=97359 RepID=A0A550CS06_9AGAR|nr:Ribophorin I [Auriculariopsis ampla]
MFWQSLPAVLLALALPCLSAPSFENTAVVRTIDLGGSVTGVTTTYAIKALEAADTYTIALSAEDRGHTSWIEAKVKGDSNALQLKEHTTNPDSDVHLVDVVLPEPLLAGATLNLVLDTVQTHATWPWPDQAKQTDEQALKYKTGLFVISPYETLVQRTKMRLASPSVISFTEPENMSAFTTDAPVTRSGATITYGPYSNVPPSATSDFAAQTQQSVVVHYKYEYPVYEVTEYKRAAEISHWGANLNIQDEIVLYNAGPTLKGHFSRLDYQGQAYFKRSNPLIIPGLALHLPAGVRDVYYYDQIGNVSTSALRVPPKSSKRSNQFSLLEMRPRYPILGGWKYAFTLGWDAPLADSASYDAATGTYIVEVPIMISLPAAVVDEVEVKIILPEGATDVTYTPPFPALSNWASTHITYLDTTGRPELTFKYKDLTEKHAQSIYVSYKVSTSAHLKKPLTVATALLGLFAFATVARRINLSIDKQQKQ